MDEKSTPKGSVLITGAAHRIGRALALDMAKCGYRVGVHYLSSEDGARDVVEKITADGGLAQVFQADLNKFDDLYAMMDQCVREFGHLDCLINNASLFEEDDVCTLSGKSWEAHLDTNLRAPIFLAQQFAAQLPKGRSGNIINIIDQRVRALTPLFFSYTISKSALWTATQTMAQALAPNIRVNGIGPGPVMQSIHQSAEQFENQCRATLLERGTSAEEIARAVQFILDASSLTGQMIALDGGQHLAWQTPDVIGAEG